MDDGGGLHVCDHSLGLIVVTEIDAAVVGFAEEVLGLAASRSMVGTDRAPEFMSGPQ